MIEENSPRGNQLKKVFNDLPAFNVEKRLKAQDEMIAKLLEENIKIYTQLKEHKPLTLCPYCGYKVIVRLAELGYVCNECDKLL